MDHPRSAFGAFPSRGPRQRPGEAGSAACTGRAHAAEPGRRRALALLAGVAGGLLTGVAGAQGNATDEAEIRRVLELQVDAFNIADAAALARDFTRDADFVGIAGDHCQGRDDIERKHITWFATKFRGSRLELRSTALRQKTHSSAVVDVEYLMTGYQAPAEGSLPSGPIRARMKFVFTRERQRWLVVSARQLELAPATPN